MKVKLLTHTPEPEKIIAAAAKLCYSNKVDIDSIMDDLTPENTEKFIEDLMDMGHESPLEHVSFTFAVEEVSRNFTHELVRHRLSSYSQRSMRYCSESNCKIIKPVRFNYKEDANKVFDDFSQASIAAYNELLNQGVAKEDARYILPNGVATRIIFTMNLRTLLHFFNLRICNRAMLEMRLVAAKMLELCKEVSPVLFKKAGASCRSLGYCPEGSKCCGAAPTLDMLLKAYEKVSCKEVDPMLKGDM